MRVRVFLLVVLLLGQMHPSNAAVKVGDKCSKVGVIVKSKPTNFICVKSGKVNRWAKVKQAATPTPTPTPSKTPVVPPVSPTATPIPTVTPGKAENLVVKKINTMFGSLSVPTTTTPPEVTWLTSPDLNQTRLESLKFQHQRLSDSFPSLYFWNRPALAIVSPDITWIKVKMEEAGCQGGVMDMVRRLEVEKNLIGAGTSVCRGVLTAYFLDRGFSDVMWSNVLGSEFGGAIQENAYKKSPAYKSGDPNWYSNTVNWYAEGSQTILSVIASARVTRSWSHQGRNLERISPYCAEDTLTVNKCGNFIGEVAVELLIALYGWDSATRWFENIDQNKKQEVTFEETFKDPLEKFQGWADSYYRYIVKGEPLPASLLTRLGG